MCGLVQPVSHSGASPADCSIHNVREFKAPPPSCLSPSLISIFSHPRIPPHALLCSVCHHSFFSSTSSSSSSEFPLLIILNSCLKALFGPPHLRDDGSLERSQHQTCFHLYESRDQLSCRIGSLFCFAAMQLLSDVSAFTGPKSRPTIQSGHESTSSKQRK